MDRNFRRLLAPPGIASKGREDRPSIIDRDILASGASIQPAPNRVIDTALIIDRAEPSANPTITPAGSGPVAPLPIRIRAVNRVEGRLNIPKHDLAADCATELPAAGLIDRAAHCGKMPAGTANRATAAL